MDKNNRLLVKIPVPIFLTVHLDLLFLDRIAQVFHLEVSLAVMLDELNKLLKVYLLSPVNLNLFLIFLQALSEAVSRFQMYESS